VPGLIHARESTGPATFRAATGIRVCVASELRSLPSSHHARRLLICAVLFAALILATGAAASPPASAAGALKTCAYLSKYDTSVGARHVSCGTARKVARAYMAANNTLVAPQPHLVLGFRCTVVWVGHPRSDWYANCRKGKALVRAVPE
jgi:hypothetical protein